MLHLVTGIPGHGKTINTIDRVEILRLESNRQVFYHGINELKLDWNYFDDPSKWYELPDNCIIVIDEAQGTFPLRDHKIKVPRMCSEFETHRHKGWDIFLITQDPMFLDIHVRRLCGQHRHVERKFGVAGTVLYDNDKYWNITEYHDRQAANKTPYKYPKKLYGAYKSATQHTVKRKIPKWLYLLPIMLALIIAAVYFFISTLFGDEPVGTVGEGASIASSLLPSTLTSSSTTKYDFVTMMKPQIPNMPHTAPFYAEIYKARDFPRPQCIASGDSSRCSCLSQQGTKMDMSMRVCLDIVKNGVFNPTIEPQNQSRRYERVERQSDEVTPSTARRVNYNY